VRTPSFVAAEPPAASRIFDLRINPVRDASGEVTTLEMALRLSEPPGEFGDPSPLVLSLAQEDEGEAGFPDAIEEVYARDGEGALGLKQAVVPASADAPAHTEWRSDRHPDGATSISYRVRVSRGEGQRYRGVRAHAGGFQGTGKSFLLLPSTPDTYTVRISWELGNLAEESSALCSFGEDDVEVALPLDRLDRAVFMAGKLGKLSVDEGSHHLRAAWLGKPGFDPVEALAWAARARAAERRLVRDRDPEPFALFLRAVPRLGPTLTASARPGGLLLLAGDDLGFTRSTRFALGRALAQRWIGAEGIHFLGPEPSTAWFSEGFATYLAREALLRAGLATPVEALDDLQEHVTRFTLSPLATLSNDELGKRLAGNEAAQKLAEDRGLLYAAELDAAVQARSGGKRGLDDLLAALLARATPAPVEDKGGDDLPTPPTVALPATAFRDLLGEELGQDAQARFDAVIVRGEKFLPPSQAFGPCFKSGKKSMARFELGFDESSLVDRKVHGLKATSAAGRAGLRDGDLLDQPVVPGGADKALELVVLRDGAKKTIRYLPQGESVNGTSWSRVSGVPDSACARPLPPVVTPAPPTP
jgi:hypothetical protein